MTDYRRNPDPIKVFARFCDMRKINEPKQGAGNTLSALTKPAFEEHVMADIQPTHAHAALQPFLGSLTKTERYVFCSKYGIGAVRQDLTAIGREFFRCREWARTELRKAEKKLSELCRSELIAVRSDAFVLQDFPVGILSKDITGRTYGAMAVIGFVSIGTLRYGGNWACRCDCGTVRVMTARAIRRAQRASCGCAMQVSGRAVATKHGQYKTRLYRVWVGMMARCYRTTHKWYHRYGGRGISVCGEWHDFEVFMAEMGQPPSSKHTLERTDNNKGYSKQNCVWATCTEQQRNRSSNVVIGFGGTSKTLAEWSEITGIKSDTISYRIKHGWTVEKSLTTPARRYHHRSTAATETPRPNLPRS